MIVVYANKVVEFKPKNTGDEIVLEQIERFLQNKSHRSKLTEKSYSKDIKDFFQVVRNKKIEELTLQDIQVTIDDFEDYINKKIKSNEVSNKTINHTVGTIKILLKYLNSKKIVEDISFIFTDSIVRLPEVKNKYGVLTVDEVFKMAELALEERRNGLTKKLFILFSLDTCVRLNAGLNIKWSDFDVRDDHVMVRYIDKGNKEFRPKISKCFYEQLLEIKNDDEDRVFNISKDSVQDTFQRLRDKMGIRKERNIVFHSIRKAGATFQYRIHSDILHVQKVLGHTNVNVTQDYIGTEDFGVIGAVSTGGNLDINVINQVSHEDLKAAIKEMNNDFKLLLTLKLNELKNKDKLN
ncbi:hypothetical protein CHH83_02190 [Bacillus sp. 7586-K]|nr:hypothetical protein CHH83_02190 [Bacillus sp. 7586-K]